MLETAVVISAHGAGVSVPIYWHKPEGRTGGSIPDSTKLWDILWENRKTILGVAHSHPGSGLPGPSYTDVTTFAPLEAALGVRLDWWITSSTHLVVCRWVGPDRLHYGVEIVKEEPEWAQSLRDMSNEREVLP